MSITSSDVAKAVRGAREARGLTQKELADLAGIGKTALFDLEHGNPGVRLSTLLSVLRVLDLHLEMADPGLVQGPPPCLPEPPAELPDHLL